jgi:hypothetical protein
MAVSNLVRAELDRYEWAQFRCGCGKTASHIPGSFEGVISGESIIDPGGDGLIGHLEIETNLFEVAVPAVGVILAALAGAIPDRIRNRLLIVLWYIASGDSHHTEMALGRMHLGDECRSRMREGIWIILHYAMNHYDETALDILELIDLDRERYSYYASKFEKRKRGI